jgi:hypothetical protein
MIDCHYPPLHLRRRAGLAISPEEEHRHSALHYLSPIKYQSNHQAEAFYRKPSAVAMSFSPLSNQTLAASYDGQTAGACGGSNRLHVVHRCSMMGSAARASTGMSIAKSRCGQKKHHQIVNGS